MRWASGNFFSIPFIKNMLDETQPELGRELYFMNEALRLARKAYDAGEVPVGAVVVLEGRVIARGWNQVESLKDATAHAEMLALTAAQAAFEDWRLNQCDLFVTKEPCPMCAGAIVHCRIKRVVFGCRDEKSGAAGGWINLLQAPNLNHHTEILPDMLADRSVELLRSFFQAQRLKSKDKANRGI